MEAILKEQVCGNQVLTTIRDLFNETKLLIGGAKESTFVATHQEDEYSCTHQFVVDGLVISINLMDNRKHVIQKGGQA